MSRRLGCATSRASRSAVPSSIPHPIVPAEPRETSSPPFQPTARRGRCSSMFGEGACGSRVRTHDQRGSAPSRAKEQHGACPAEARAMPVSPDLAFVRTEHDGRGGSSGSRAGRRRRSCATSDRVSDALTLDGRLSPDEDGWTMAQLAESPAVVTCGRNGAGGARDADRRRAPDDRLLP
jgi:hypothetical protein